MRDEIRDVLHEPASGLQRGLRETGGPFAHSREQIRQCAAYTFRQLLEPFNDGLERGGKRLREEVRDVLAETGDEIDRFLPRGREERRERGPCLAARLGLGAEPDKTRHECRYRGDEQHDRVRVHGRVQQPLGCSGRVSATLNALTKPTTV